MKFSRKPRMVSITLDGVAIEQVKDFKYLEAIFRKMVTPKTKTRVRIGLSKNVFTHLKSILTGGLRRATKKKLVKTHLCGVWQRMQQKRGPLTRQTRKD